MVIYIYSIFSRGLLKLKGKKFYWLFKAVLFSEASFQKFFINNLLKVNSGLKK